MDATLVESPGATLETTGQKAVQGPTDGWTGTSPGESLPSSQAERLLRPDSWDPASVRLRLLWGVVGLAALGAAPLVATALCGSIDPGPGGAFWYAWRALVLPAGAALTVMVPLPGLFILLGMQGDRLDARRCLGAVSRAYYRLGLLAAGVTPTLLLYGLTGAVSSITGAAALWYFAAAGVALSLLLRDLYAALPHQRPISALMLFAWGGFVSLMGLFFFVKLQFS